MGIQPPREYVSQASRAVTAAATTHCQVRPHDVAAGLASGRPASRPAQKPPRADALRAPPVAGSRAAPPPSGSGAGGTSCSV